MTASSRRSSASVVHSLAPDRLRIIPFEVRFEKPDPTLAGFATRFKDHIKLRSAEKPETIRFYNSKLDRLLEFAPLASARLHKIGDELIERYVTKRVEKGLAPANVNRELATLRRLLYLAKRWNIIATVPKIDMLAGERSRTFVLSREIEPHYLEFAGRALERCRALDP
jgi:site-specific recombinase XerC